MIQVAGPEDREWYVKETSEQALTDHLQLFITELGCGFAFADRQKHTATDPGDAYFLPYRLFTMRPVETEKTVGIQKKPPKLI